MDSVFIFSGSFTEADKFARAHRLERRQWIYISAADVLRGLINPIVFFVGTYGDRKDFSEVVWVIEMTKKPRRSAR